MFLNKIFHYLTSLSFPKRIQSHLAKTVFVLFEAIWLACVLLSPTYQAQSWQSQSLKINSIQEHNTL